MLRIDLEPHHLAVIAANWGPDKLVSHTVSPDGATFTSTYTDQGQTFSFVKGEQGTAIEYPDEMSHRVLSAIRTADLARARNTKL